MNTNFKLKLKWAFYIEGLINISTVLICFISPTFFLSQMTSESTTLLSINLVLWYGVLLLVITFIMVGILYFEHLESFLIVMLAYLLGDAIQIGLSIYFAESLNSWSFGIIFTIAITFILIVLRITILIKPKWLGFKEKEIIREDD